MGLPLFEEAIYPVLILALFVLPRFLIRFGVPTPLTALALGFFANIFFPALSTDKTIKLLSTLGVITLFLDAGLDVHVGELRKNSRVLLEHIVINVSLLALISYGFMYVFKLHWRPSTLIALGLVTPSVGFILETLRHSKSSDHTKFWVKLNAIAFEIVALTVLFFTMQSKSVVDISISMAVLLTMVLILPILFKLFARFIAPHAPDSEFGFLLVVALICGIMTRKMGAYYLVGSFIVGFAAQRFEDILPNMTSERLLNSLKEFSSLFIPFYFFFAGVGIKVSDLSVSSLLIALLVLAIITPLRLFLVYLHRRISLKESWRTSIPIAVSIMPNLVFGLVIAETLRESFGIAPVYFGAIVIYTVFVSATLSFFNRFDVVPGKLTV